MQNFGELKLQDWTLEDWTKVDESARAGIAGSDYAWLENGSVNTNVNV